ncbi:MAG: hypothetical protein HYY29_00020 [Chloroflexi bacterium]|nr:hypothetical protein [Chloroflexota bacterium]
MASLDDYLQDVVNVFASITPFAEFVEEPLADVLAAELGILTFIMKFADRSQLYFVATIDFSSGYPTHTNYSIHYQSEIGDCIFRYDNTPHHPKLSPFPQHKHLGKDEHAVNGALPSMRQIAREIQSILAREI